MAKTRRKFCHSECNILKYLTKRGRIQEPYKVGNSFKTVFASSISLDNFKHVAAPYLFFRQIHVLSACAMPLLFQIFLKGCLFRALHGKCFSIHVFAKCFDSVDSLIMDYITAFCVNGQ